MSLLQTVRQYLGKSEINRIADQLGVDPRTAESAVTSAVPMIVGGMATHANTAPNGAEQIKQAVDTHQGATDDVPATVRDAAAAGGGGLLNRIFGVHQERVLQAIQQASGLTFERAKQLVATLTPLVLGAFARHGTNPDEADPGQLRNDLQREARSVQAEVPHLGGILGKALDAFS